MGSRRTHDDRLARLRDEGVAEAELARLASPIGLDIGARTPEAVPPPALPTSDPIAATAPDTLF
jgi:XdhC Rossmann domain